MNSYISRLFFLLVLTIKKIIERKRNKVSRIYKNNIFDGILSIYQGITHITDNIYLSSSFSVINLENLEKLRIYDIINCTKDIPNWFEQDERFDYMRIKINDDGKEKFSNKILEDSYNFITEKSNNSKILIHCYLGRSRSVTVILYYLLKKYNINKYDALNIIKEKRPNINVASIFFNNLPYVISKENNFRKS